MARSNNFKRVLLLCVLGFINEVVTQGLFTNFSQWLLLFLLNENIVFPCFQLFIFAKIFAAILGVIFSLWTTWRRTLISYKCFKLWNVKTTLISNLLLHVVHKEKIAPKIAAKIATVNVPLEITHQDDAGI
jgi:hypothetical protein